MFTTFTRRQRAVRRAAEAVERARLDQEEADRRERAAKAEEARQLNIEVNRRLRRFSGESDDEAPAQTTGRRRSSRIDRQGSCTAEEALAINKLVKEKALLRRASAGARGATRDADALATPPASATPTKRSSRERLAEMAREADERRRALTAEKRPADEKRPAEPTARAIGTARASAKVAGGFFYTRDEHSEVLARTRRLQSQNRELAAQLAKLDGLGAALESGKLAALLSAVETGRDWAYKLDAAGNDASATPPATRPVASATRPVASTTQLSIKREGGVALLEPTADGTCGSPSFLRRRRLSGGKRALAAGVAAALGALGGGDGGLPGSRDGSAHALRRAADGLEAACLDASPVLLVRPPPYSPSA